MKKYFVKWLPVNEKLKSGDKAIETIYKNRIFDVTQIYEQEGYTILLVHIFE